jgi:hypothetical protein
MSLRYARKRRFTIEEDDINQIRFVDGSVQDVIGQLTLPVSFRSGSPSSVLVK